VVGLDGAKAMEPIASEAFWSPTAVQAAPAFVLRQIPPCAPPIRTVLPVVSLGSTAIAVMRPVTGLKIPPVVGAGPMGFHGAVESVGAGVICGAEKATNEPSGRCTNFPSATIMRCMCCQALKCAPAGMCPLTELRCL